MCGETLMLHFLRRRPAGGESAASLRDRCNHRLLQLRRVGSKLRFSHRHGGTLLSSGFISTRSRFGTDSEAPAGQSGEEECRNSHSRTVGRANVLMSRYFGKLDAHRFHPSAHVGGSRALISARCPGFASSLTQTDRRPRYGIGRSSPIRITISTMTTARSSRLTRPVFL
jgi:hypothetical protein